MESKFNLKDRLYFTHNNMILCGCANEISMAVSDNIYNEYYSFSINGTSISISVEKLYTSREDLIKNL